ncbi:MAG: hypothetical protein ACSHX8_01505 [Opitutaceae bacterium]
MLSEPAAPNMNTDEDEPITLSKWPFYVGDILLVATALTIAVVRDWDLSSGQIAACVAAVALGACLFVLPFIVEFQIRVREEREDRSSELRAVRKHVATLEEVLELAAERIQRLERQMAPTEQAIELLSNSLEQQSAEMETFNEAQKAEITVLQKAVDAVQAKAGKSDPSVIKSIEVMEAKLATLSTAEALEQLVQRVKTLEDAPVPEPIIKEVIKEVSADPAVEAEPQDAEPAKDKPRSRARRERQKPEPRLLNRAIQGNQDSSSAVSRIITSKSKSKEEPESEAKAEPEVVGSKPAEHAPEPKVQAEDKPKEEVKVAVAPTDVKEPPAEPAPVKVEKTSAPSEIEPPVDELPSEEAAANMVSELFTEAPVAVPKASPKLQKGDTAVIANIFIGIGNKPYIRGNGGGLELEKGRPMEFVEIGKWQWLATEPFEEAIEVQIYRNDDEADKNGPQKLESGQNLTISPKF